MNEKKEEWTSAEVVFGRLTAINKELKRVTIEIREIDPDSERWIWVPYSYDISEDFSDEDCEELLSRLDQDIKLKLIDGDVTEILPT